MKISGLEFAFNDLEQKVHIDVAQKNTRWWLLEDKKIELVLCEGEKVKKYWRTKSDSEFRKMYPDGVKQYWNRESEQHKYIKRQLLEKKILPINDKVWIKAHSVKEEVWFDSISKRPDVVFYDEDGNIMCLIEIYYSHKKSQADIKKLSELNLPVFEINVSNYEIGSRDKKNKARVNLIFNPERTNESSTIKGEIKRTEKAVKENEQIYKSQYRELAPIKDQIKWAKRYIRELDNEYKWVEGEIQSGGIRRLEKLGREIRRVRGDIGIQDRTKLETDAAIQNIERRIREAESSIAEEEAQRQLERYSMWAERWGDGKQNPLF